MDTLYSSHSDEWMGRIKRKYFRTFAFSAMLLSKTHERSA